MQKPNRKKSELTKVSEIISLVKDNLGLDNNLKIAALNELWPLVTSFEIAQKSRPAYFDKDQNLVITVTNSVMATELLMQKINIIQKLKEATKDTDINFKDIRFVVRA